MRTEILNATFCAYDSPQTLGGPATWLQRLFPALRSEGIESRGLFLTWGDTNTGPTLSALRTQGFDCTATPCHEHTNERVRWILSGLQQHPPDVFVPNLVPPAFFASRLVREAGIPTVGVLHSDDEFYHGLMRAFVFGPRESCVSSLVCVSRELERQALAEKPSHTDVRRIAYGVPIPASQVRRQPTRLRIAYLGRLVEEQKRITEVTRAFCRVVREVPGTDAVLFGDGDARSAVEKILADEGAGLEVRLAGRVDPGRIQGDLLHCDVIVLLSDYEGLPIALMEAMACGCVPVCMRIRSGIPELVADGVTGLLVESRGDELVSAIRRLREEAGLWDRLSKGARAKIAKDYSIGACAKQWAQLFRELKAASGPKRPIEIPRRIKLPPPHPGFAREDPRPSRPSALPRIYRRSRMLIGRMRRRF
jgi:colanic acid/amylovoran biosynthesis glycosyltransferase